MQGSVRLRARNGTLVDVVVDRFRNVVAVAGAYIERGFIVQSWQWDGVVRSVGDLDSVSRHPVMRDRRG